MTDNELARASEIEAHTEATTEKTFDLAPPATNHLDAIISLFPSLPATCQQAIRANVEALAALSV